MLHNHDTNWSGCKPPTGLPNKTFLFLFIFKLDTEHFGKVLSQIVTGSSLNSTTIFIDPSLNGWSTISTWEFLWFGFDTFNDWNSQKFFISFGIEFQIGVHLLFSFLKGGMGSVSFLPQEFSCSDEWGWVFEFPSDDVSPLI